MLRLFRVTQFSRVYSHCCVSTSWSWLQVCSPTDLHYTLYGHYAPYIQQRRVVKKVELACIYSVQSFGIYMVKVFADSVCGRHGTTLGGGGDTLARRPGNHSVMAAIFTATRIVKCTIRSIYTQLYRSRRCNIHQIYTMLRKPPHTKPSI